MKIAVAFKNDEIFQHFGHCEQFKMYQVEDGKVVASEVVSTNGAGHGAVAKFLSDNNVDTVICGGIGGCAKNALAHSNIKLYGGVTGNADYAVDSLLADDLNYDEDPKCSGHEHSHGESHSHNCNGHCHH